MDSTFFSSNYRQYKKDPEYIAGWLAETSQKIGYQRTSDPVPPEPAKPSQRLKGKARKEAKSAATASTNGNSATYRIRVGEFIPMAEAIAKQSIKIEVPRALVTLFGRAVKARQKVAEWFQGSHNSPAVDESNQSRAHFVTILEEASSILQPLVKERPPQKSKQERLASMRDTNAFSSLNVKGADKSDDMDKTTPAIRDEEPLESLPSVPQVELQQDESETEAEFFFAIVSFLTNVHELRDIVQETWFEYKDGKLESIQASLVANTAIDLVRHAEAEFDLLLKRPKKYPASNFPVWTLPALLFSSQHEWTTSGNTLQEFLFPLGVMFTKDHVYSQVDWCFWPVYAALKYYLHAVMTAKKPKTDIPIIAHSAFDCVGGVHEDSLRTVALAQKFRRVVLLHKNDDVARDEVTRGMEHMFAHREVPIWTTFGIQILLDIEDILTPACMEDPFRELCDHVDQQISANEALAQTACSPFEYVGNNPAKIQKDLLRELQDTKEDLAKDSCNTPQAPPYTLRIDEARHFIAATYVWAGC